MNGRVLFDFMFDQFVWPAHPFAARSFESSARGPRDETCAVHSDADASPTAGSPKPPSPRAVIVLAAQRKKTT